VNPALAAVVAQASSGPVADVVEEAEVVESVAVSEAVVEQTSQMDVVTEGVVDGEAAVAVTGEERTLPSDQAPPSEQALKILEIAQRTADETVAHAKSEASSILTKARSQAAEVTADLDAQRTALEKQVGQLRTFERNYRIALRDHIAGQLAEFDRAASKEDSVVGPPPAIESVQAVLDE